jgi:hypothetical protein
MATRLSLYLRSSSIILSSLFLSEKAHLNCPYEDTVLWKLAAIISIWRISVALEISAWVTGLTAMGSETTDEDLGYSANFGGAIDVVIARNLCVIVVVLVGEPEASVPYPLWNIENKPPFFAFLLYLSRGERRHNLEPVLAFHLTDTGKHLCYLSKHGYYKLVSVAVGFENSQELMSSCKTFQLFFPILQF